MSLTDHLHKKNDPIRAFLDERLVDFSPARPQWKAVQSGGVLVDADASGSWSLIGTAIDLRIRFIFANLNFEIAPQGLSHLLATTYPSVKAGQTVQNRHRGSLFDLRPEEEIHVLQTCYLMSMYLSVARGTSGGWRNLPLHTLRGGAGWKAHLDRVPDWDIDVLKVLVKPALELFPLLTEQRVVVGPVFADSVLVGGADGDFIVSKNLIEIKCEAPGFRSTTIRQLIAYALLDSTNEYELAKCSVYLARFGTLAAWDLDDLITEISQGRHSYQSLRTEFHQWLVAQEEDRRRKREAKAESGRIFEAQWKLLSDARAEYWRERYEGDLKGEEVKRLTRKVLEADNKLKQLEAEAGLDSYRE
jgi:hypothetical protein